MTLGAQAELGQIEPERFKIVVPGDPTPWERAGVKIMPGGKARKIEGYVYRPWPRFNVPTQTAKAEKAVAEAWKAAGHARIEKGIPCVMRAIFVFARPDGHYGTGRNAAVVKPAVQSKRPGGRGNKNRAGQRTGGDLDNCVKLVSDGLNEVAYADDGQIVELTAMKLFVDQAGVSAPATLVEIWPA